MTKSLQLLAGPKALSLIRERGLRAEDVDIIAGASGGPKWLVLSGLDRVVFGDFLAGRQRPVDLVGSSIGSWRMACLAQNDPVAAIGRLEDAYIEQRYSRRPLPGEVSMVAANMLDKVLGESGAREILDHPWARLHVITARCRGLAGSETRQWQMAGLAVAALSNVISRRALCWQMQRVIFSSPGGQGPFRDLNDFPTRHVTLGMENLRPALMASGSIPLVLKGVDIPGAPAGIYRDGGMIDYHLDLDYGRDEGIVLYPHFYPHVVPGWFDKSLPWRKARRNMSRVLLLAPTDEFIATLPGGRIPDRKDFYRHDNAERIRIWRNICAASNRLGEEFRELMESGKWQERVRPFAD